MYGLPLSLGVALFILFDFTDLLCTDGGCTREAVLGVDSRAQAISRILARVRGRASFAFFCGGGRISLGHGMALGIGGRGIFSILGGLFSKAGAACGILSGGVVLSRGSTVSSTAGRMTVMRRMNHDMGNIIISSGKRPMVNTAIVIGNSAGKAVASFSKGFVLGSISDGTSLVIDCIKCMARAVDMGKGSSFGVIVGRSTGALRRIIIVKCKMIGGHSLANSSISIANTSLTRIPIAGTTRTLTKGTTKIGVISRGKTPKTRIGVAIHKNASVARSAAPVCVVSNFRSRSNLGGVSMGSVGAVSVLGSTSAATVCKTHKSGNIILVAAGDKDDNGAAIGCGNCMSIS